MENRRQHRQRLEALGSLAAEVAHEFNNLLLPMMLFTNAALQDLPPDSRARADLERVLTQARRAKDIVQKILRFSRAFGDTQVTPIDLRAVLDEGRHLISALAPPGIVIRAEISADVPPVMGNTSLALDMVINLCTNALQSMGGANGVLTFGLCYPHHSSISESRVELWVKDTGHGMDAATTQRIFEPFFTTRPIGEGTGLGLSIVHGIVESFGASIAVDSVVGTGTTVRIYFPPVH